MKISKNKLKTRVINGNEYLVYRFMREGKSKSIYGKSYTEIQKKYDKYLKENNTSTSNKTFNYYFEKYLHDRKLSWKAQTYTSRYNFYINHVNQSKLGKMKFSKVNKTDVINFINKLELSNSTKKQRLQILNQFYNWCIENEYIDTNICKGITIKVRECNLEVISTDLVNRILNDVNGTDIEAPIILLCFGARLGEAMAANVNNLDDEGILITHSLTKCTINGHTKTFLESPKNASSIRKIYLPSEVINTLRHCPTAIDGHYCKGVRNWYSRNRLYHFLSRYDVTPHDLRKFYATMLLRNNINIFTVKNQLGHSKDSNNTLKYYLLKDSNKIKKDMNKFFGESE